MAQVGGGATGAPSAGASAASESGQGVAAPLTGPNGISLAGIPKQLLVVVAKMTYAQMYGPGFVSFEKRYPTLSNQQRWEILESELYCENKNDRPAWYDEHGEKLITRDLPQDRRLRTCEVASYQVVRAPTPPDSHRRSSVGLLSYSFARHRG